MPSGRPSDSPDQPPSGTGTPVPDAARRVGRPSNERFRLRFTRNLNRLLDQQAFMLAANDIFNACAVLFVLLIGLVWLARPERAAPPAGSADAGGAH